MNDIFKVFILATTGALIGYITNVIAIKLIFRPIEPVKIPILNIEVRGLIPKRRSEIATTIGEIIEEEFLSVDEILTNLVTEKDKDNVVEYIKIKVKLIINDKAGFIPSTFKNMIQDYIAESIEKEVRESIDDLSEELIIKASQRIDVKKIVEEKINELNLYELEKIILQVAKKELKHIEVLGLVLGCIIGLVQGLIVVIL